jgi:hypothetical protein
MANTPNPSTKATKATAPAAATPEPEPEHSSKLPPAAETTEPSTEDGARTVLQTDDTAVIVESPPLEGSAGPGRVACVVPGDRHMGAAVPGSLVCSYHTMHYDTAGNLRTTKETLPDGTEPKKEDKAA